MKYLMILTLFISAGCSSLNSLNQVPSASLILKGGKSKSLEWSESLTFKRRSWFNGATLKYDILVAKLDRQSPFYNWLGQSERSQFNSCPNYYITLVFASNAINAVRASKVEFMSNFDLVGLKRISIPIFESNLRNHAFNQNRNLMKHTLYGMCKTNNLTDVEVNVPNYSTVRVLD